MAATAVAAGLIHLDAAFDHLDLPWVAGGFLALTAAQIGLAAMLWSRPGPAWLTTAATVHAGILALWVVTRTVGLRFVPGAEAPAAVGIPDLVANAFSILVIAIALTMLFTADATVVLHRKGLATRAGFLVGALLTVIAVSAPHQHVTHGVPAESAATHGHDHDH